MQIEIPDNLFNAEELKNTPDRIARFLAEWAAKDVFKFTVFDNPGYDQMIILKHIEVASLCSHHLLPFTGKAHVGYIPAAKICGISKLARVVDMFASKPQIQEQLTQQIADFLVEKLDPIGVIVVIEAQHQCMQIRIKGIFKEDEKARMEFMELIRT
jgi:GTP cyclohydrolase I